ncbi:unnamed protein product [Zymoseptoria tritici ST99CH_3D1]|uniref:Uncharacterized protein n=1 Tax=Zymoseptoria tritici ST99CH_1E4 TaxID=1276532 RepID=A0A2H1G3P7_ZYMTR|nr:unnamed protein product [Zymoseptoria tritici ST99CH_1E4]SMR49370.1 unnamed protein product [Zymoseptoria tritici ST99CH_3D1]
MSTLSPRVEKPMAKLLGDALRLLNDTYPEENFPVIKENDPLGLLNDSYLCIEAKNILIAILLGDLWENLAKKCKTIDLPMPVDCPPGFRLSMASWWPAATTLEGIIGYAADKQADTLADLTFTRLMYLSSKKCAKKHADLLTADEVEDENDNEDEDILMDDEGDTALVAAPLQDLLPSAWLEKKTYRLTRDWKKYPSAGVLSHPVSDIQQSQYGAAADVIFETMKFEAGKAKSKTAKILVSDDSANAIELSRDTGAASVYWLILDGYIADKSIKGKLIKGASKNVADEVQKFTNWLNDHSNDYNHIYLDDGGQQQDFIAQLNEIADEDRGSFYTRACKSYAKWKVTGTTTATNSVMTGSVRTVSLAGDASLIGDDGNGLDSDAEAAPAADRGRGRGGRGGGRGATGARGRGRGRARGGGGLGAPRGGLGRGAGNKRARGDDDEEDEEEGGEVNSGRSRRSKR